MNWLWILRNLFLLRWLNINSSICDHLLHLVANPECFFTQPYATIPSRVSLVAKGISSYTTRANDVFNIFVPLHLWWSTYHKLGLQHFLFVWVIHFWRCSLKWLTSCLDVLSSSGVLVFSRIWLKQLHFYVLVFFI